MILLSFENSQLSNYIHMYDFDDYDKTVALQENYGEFTFRTGSILIVQIIIYVTAMET